MRGVCLFLWIIALSSVAGSVLFAKSSLGRTGPAEDPEKWPDWGGTPDIPVPEGTGLTSGELGDLLQQLKSTDQSVRARAADEIVRDGPGSEATFRRSLFRDHGARNAEMKAALREAERRAEKADKKDALLEGLLTIDPAHPELGTGAVGALRVLTMLTALDALDTLAAYKVMIEFSPRHAGVFRHEIGRMLIAHGVDVMPALIYGRGSKSEEIHMFSVKWIRDMGNPLLSEQVKIKNPRRLAQLLEAYASVNELDAIDVTLSLTNHQSVFVRAAARSALRVYGRNALWPARRKYENTFNEEPANDASVESVLKALYKHFDKKRLMATEKIFTKGLGLYRKGKLPEMEQAYREVLSKEPLFPRRGEMAEGFLALSRSYSEKGESALAKKALLTALWVSEPESDIARQIEARQLWLRAEELKKAGLATPGVYQRILELDPTHEGAAEMLATLVPQENGRSKIIVKAVIVSFIIFLAAILVFLRIRTS
jgi:tetratricopeptide (TPR) repeat protein